MLEIPDSFLWEIGGRAKMLRQCNGMPVILKECFGANLLMAFSESVSAGERSGQLDSILQRHVRRADALLALSR